MQPPRGRASLPVPAAAPLLQPSARPGVATTWAAAGPLASSSLGITSPRSYNSDVAAQVAEWLRRQVKVLISVKLAWVRAPRGAIVSWDSTLPGALARGDLVEGRGWGTPWTEAEQTRRGQLAVSLSFPLRVGSEPQTTRGQWVACQASHLHTHELKHAKTDVTAIFMHLLCILAPLHQVPVRETKCTHHLYPNNKTVGSRFRWLCALGPPSPL